MFKSIARKRDSVVRCVSRSTVIEALEGRQMLSVSPPLVSLHPVAPAKILAGGKTAYEVVTVRNLTTATVTEGVSITLQPSLDGSTVAGTLGGGTFSETVTLKKHAALNLKVGFVPPITQAAGKYYTLVTTTVGDTTSTTVAPKTYTLTLPPAPTTTPSLVGDFSGLIVGTTTSSVGLFGSSTTTKALTFSWHTTSQTDTSLTGTFAVGAQQSTGTMVGSELTNGKMSYSLTSDLINYTIVGKVAYVKGVETITGTFNGTLVGNLFSKLQNGHYKLVPPA